MMQMALTTLAVCILASSPSASAATIFHGAIAFISAEDCQYTQAGWRFVSVYRLSNLGGGTNISSISTIYHDGSVGYERVGRFTENFTPVKATGFDNNGKSSRFKARIRVTGSKPSNLTPATNFVSITGQIEGPFDDPGVSGIKCVVTFRASYSRRL